MREVLAFIMVVCAFAKAYTQELSAETVLQKAIAYHDPSGAWDTFKGTLSIQLETPKNPVRKSEVTLSAAEEFFAMTTVQDGVKSYREIDGDQCRFSSDTGVTETKVDDEACERTLLYRDYYSYLYGLPMKLRDEGTLIDPEVSLQTFKGKEYLVLKVTYDESVGSDIWQFYFDPVTYTMEVYQFFKGEDRSSGEYILLSDEVVINGIKMPKDRAWYYNKDDGYLGTDRLLNE